MPVTANPTPTPKPFDSVALAEFYSVVLAEAGVPVVWLMEELKALFGRPRSDNDLRAYRLSRQPWKKLADEVSPVSRWLSFTLLCSGRIRFPLNNQPPDAWLWNQNDKEPVGIEVTIAQARERFHLAQELVSNGLGRGFIGVHDDAPQEKFDAKMAKTRIAYSSLEVFSAIGAGIARCLAKKNHPKFTGFTLLVQAPLLTLPKDRWQALEPDLRARAAALPFKNIFVMSDANDKPWGFQIK